MNLAVQLKCCVCVRFVITWASVTVMLAMHLHTVTGRAMVAASTVVRWLFYKVITYIMLSLGVYLDDDGVDATASRHLFSVFCSNVYFMFISVSVNVDLYAVVADYINSFIE